MIAYALSALLGVGLMFGLPLLLALAWQAHCRRMVVVRRAQRRAAHARLVNLRDRRG